MNHRCAIMIIKYNLDGVGKCDKKIFEIKNKLTYFDLLFKVILKL